MTRSARCALTLGLLVACSPAPNDDQPAPDAGDVATGGMATGGTGGTATGGTATGGTATGGAATGGAATGGAATGGAATGGAGPLPPITVYVAGDSTVSTYRDTASDADQAGWGQMLPLHFDAGVTVDNRAIGGRTARRFIDEGYLDQILAVIQPGDFLLVQFGTNDGNRTATYQYGGQTIPYYLDPQTDFKTYLTQYVVGARAHSATPVFVTPPPRSSAYCTGGNGTGAHAQAMRELGAAEGVVVADLNQKTVNYLMAICPAPATGADEHFFFVRADGTIDGTHFQENGARTLAGFVADGIREAGLPLAGYLLP